MRRRRQHPPQPAAPAYRVLAGIAAAAALLLAGCTSPQAGAAMADRDAVRAFNAERFDEAFAMFDEWMVTEQDVKATVFWHGQYNDRTARREVDITIYHGTNSSDPAPPAFHTQSRTEEGARDHYDEYHPSGSEYDYALLGEKYQDLAPTDWIAYPTAMHADGYNVCMITGWQTLCNMGLALERTHERHAENVVKQYSEAGDGTIELRTGVTLLQVLDSRVYGPQVELINEIDDELLDQFIPVTIRITPDGELQEFRFNGTVEAGGDSFAVDAGFVVEGESTASDFPPPPSAFDVTELTRDEYSELMNRKAEIDDAS